MKTKTVRVARKLGRARPSYGFSPSSGERIAEPDTLYETIPVDAHMMVLGPTGVGKTTGTILPRLLDYEGPAIVLDVKGEIYQRTARRRREMGHTVSVLDPLGSLGQGSITLNPLAHISPSPDPENLSWQVAKLLMPPLIGKDTFWETNAASLIQGLILFVADRERRTGQIARMADVHDALMCNDVAYGLANLLDNEPDMPDLAQRKISTVLQMPDVTRGGVFASTIPALHLFGLPQVRDVTGEGGMALSALCNDPHQTLYICMPPHSLGPYGPLLRMWFDMILGSLFTRNAIPDLPTLLAIDEAAALGRMDQIEAAFTQGRGYGVSLITAFQSLHQVRSLYASASQTLFDNAGATMAFPPNNMATAHDLVGLVGGVSADALLALNARTAMLATPGQPARIVERYDVRFDPELAAKADPNPRHLHG